MCACIHTKLENGVLQNKQQSGSTVNSFINLGKFEAIYKALSEGEYSNHFWDIIVENSGLNKKERMGKMALLLLHTFAFSCLLQGFWASL